MNRLHSKSVPAALLLFTALLLMPQQPAFAFWGLLGKAGSAAGKSGAAVGKSAAGTVGKGAAVGAGAETVAAGGLLDDAARGGAKLGAADLATANAALPPEVARYLAKPANTLGMTDTADMMALYQRMVQNAGKTGDFTVVERLPGMTSQGKTIAEAATPAKAAGAVPVAQTTKPLSVSASSSEIPTYAIHLLLHAAKAGNPAARIEISQRCAAAHTQGRVGREWQAACNTVK